MGQITLTIEGQKVRVDDAFNSLSPEQQSATIDEIAASLGLEKGDGESRSFMGQVNAGIGDVVDLLNPFDTPAVSQALGMGDRLSTGSAADVMNAVGIKAATDAPQGALEAFARGGGQAIASAPLVGAGANAMRGAGGLVGAIADDAARSLNTVGGAVTEGVSGGLSLGGATAAEDAGAPQWAQGLASIATPIAAAGAVGAAYKAAPYTLVPTATRRIRAELAPFTKKGATEVARRRMQSLAGGPKRAEELASQIGGENPLGLTPAQQTGDPNLLAVDKLAAEQSPQLRSELKARQQAGQSTARNALTPEGNTDDALQFFEAQRSAFRAEMRDRVAKAQQQADAALSGIKGQRGEAENSLGVVENINAELRVAKETEAQLWEAVDGTAIVPTSSTKAKAAEWRDKLGRAKAGDMPPIARELLLEDGGYGSGETVTEMHNLYSELRELARNAKAGTNQKRTLAKVANEIADAILEDLGAKQADTTVGRQINEARAFSAALHETFDQGAPGRLLRQTTAGDAAIDPELALKRTAGRGGTEGAVAARQIEQAGADRALIADYLKGQFAEKVRSKGTLTGRDAAVFTTRNKPLLERFPELKAEIGAAIRAKESADQLADRIAKRLPELERKSASNVAKFVGGNPDKAVQSVFADARPARAAQKLVNAARKDTTGRALAGVKRAFADSILNGASSVRSGADRLSADAILGQLSDPKKSAALKRVFSPAEMGRFRLIARELAKAEQAQAATQNIGESLSGAKVNKVIEYAARVFAANRGAQLGNEGASLQTAQMASSRVRDMLAGLTADRASRLMAQAVTDPDLFKALLTNTANQNAGEKVANRLVPWLAGATSSLSANNE